MKEGLEEDLDRLKSRKDDMLTIAEIGVDQLIVDEMQEFRYAQEAIMYGTLPAKVIAFGRCDSAGGELRIISECLEELQRRVRRLMPRRRRTGSRRTRARSFIERSASTYMWVVVVL